MSIPTSLYVVFLWAVVLIIALGGIGLATYSGLNLRYDLLFWRKVKLFSAFLGIVGLMLLLVNLEKIVRDTVALPSKAFVLGLFNDTKSLTTVLVSKECSHENDSDVCEASLLGRHKSGQSFKLPKYFGLAFLRSDQLSADVVNKC